MMNFQATDNDLSFQQFDKVRDFLLYLTQVSPVSKEKWIKEGMSHSLDLLVKNPEVHHRRYDESSADFDPFKKRVLEGVVQGLTMASVDHQQTGLN